LRYRDDFITQAEERVFARPRCSLGQCRAHAFAMALINEYRHHIPPVAELPYSVTFRTLR
jgi:hypothetical protein